MANRRGNRSIVATRPAATVRDWPEDQRPRERLLRQGAQALSEAELLAIFLRIGLPGRSVLDLARDALVRFGSLNGLLNASPDEIQQMPGFGPAKSAQLLAVIELARRALQEDLRRDPLLDSPPKVRDYLRLRIGQRHQEVFMAVFLDAQNRLIEADELFTGTLTQTSVYPREVVKRALDRKAAAVIFAHNHPSGLAEPSRADELLTRTLRDALALVDVRVLDHIIVAGAKSVSFAERGLL
jgi:DNA repair protein RadC